jgi:DNA/RNA-binding domain of Phe-tRNA-synthetase-like protein
LLTAEADYLVTSIIHHDPALRTEFPTLVAAALVVEGVDRLTATELDPVPHLAAARARLVDANEGALPEIRAWRAAFTAMGLKPTQYRCASESLLRRLRTQGDMPALHPLIDFGNAVSAAFAIPLAIFDIDHVALPLVVTHAMGDERYITFAGEEEHPEPGEVIFCDAEGWAHSRRWTHRQSGRSAVRASTRRALLVTEALHDGAAADVASIADTLTTALRAAGADVERVVTVD